MTDKVLIATCEMTISEWVTQSVFQDENLEKLSKEGIQRAGFYNGKHRIGGGSFQQSLICHLSVLPC